MKSNILTNEEISDFALALEHLIHSGISAADALTLIKEDEQSPKLKTLFEKMAQKADNGTPLSEAIRQSEAFPTYFAALTEVGESSGRIEQTLHSLADYYSKRDQMEKRLRASLLYPTVLLLVLLAVMGVLLIWVLPLFNEVYLHLGSELSGAAGLLLAFGKGLRKALPIISAVLLLTLTAFIIPFIRNKGFAVWNKMFGDCGAKRKVHSARFVHAISMAVSSGMNYEEALTLACGLSSGEAAAFKLRCQDCLEAVSSGKELSAALLETGFISKSQQRLLNVGRRSGKEEAVLEQVTAHLTEEAENALNRRAALFEPAMVAVACVLIAAVLFSVMLPLIQIMNAIG